MSGDITTRDRLRAARRGLGGVIVVWGMALAGLQGWRIGWPQRRRGDRHANRSGAAVRYS